ncbi:MAG: anhydro-N-acetylmuramic acid kinase [Nocardioidaceae bacterium]
MRVIGVMSGTSYDSIDVAAADLRLEGEVVRLRPIGALQVSYADEMRSRIAGALPPAQTTIAEVCRLDTELGRLFADAARLGVDELCGGRADLVVSHGQTVYHWVDLGGEVRGTLQLGQPAWIAERTGLPVVSDLRSRDVARGGQGAPLVSMFDVLLLGGSARRGALNLGGIANLTVVAPGADPLAYDIGPANALVDAAMRQLVGSTYDEGGAHAARGTVHAGLLASLLDEPYFDRAAPKSTGKETFHWGYLAERLAKHGAIPAADVVTTVSELTAQVVAVELRLHDLAEVFASGGGVRNPWLMRRLRELAGGGCVVRDIAELGVGADDKEAYAFALLGFLTVHGLAGTVASCTGAAGPAVLGSITPGSTPLHLPPPAKSPPTRLQIDS